MTQDTNKRPIAIFDADNHFYETRDVLTAHLPAKFRDVIQYVDIDGQTKIVVDGVISEYIPNPTFERIGRPGAQEEYFRVGNPDGKSQRQIIGQGIDCPIEYREAAPRLALMDELGIDQCIMHPTLASLVEERLKHRPDAAAAVVHALNQWMVEHWPFSYENRIFSTPIITPGLVDEAVKEVEFAAEHGARFVLIRPAPAWGWRGPRSFSSPEFDPMWQAICDADLTVMMHASDSGYVCYENEWLGSSVEFRVFDAPDAFRMAVKHDCRPIQDAITSLITGRTLERFPELRFVAVENGAEWVPNLLRGLDYVHRNLPQAFAERPSDTVRRSFWIAPFHEEDPAPIIDLVGEDRVVFGSDYPHVEGMSDPKTYADHLDGLAPKTIAKIMGGNMRELSGVKATS